MYKSVHTIFIRIKLSSINVSGIISIALIISVCGFNYCYMLQLSNDSNISHFVMESTSHLFFFWAHMFVIVFDVYSLIKFYIMEFWT